MVLTKEFLRNEARWFALSKYEAAQIWAELSGAEKDVLLQLTKVTWDGNLASKVGRCYLVVKGLAIQYEGFQVISNHGLILLQALGKLEQFTK